MSEGGTIEYPDIIYTKEGRVVTITLNRPERMNAFRSIWQDFKPSRENGYCRKERGIPRQEPSHL